MGGSGGVVPVECTNGVQDGEETDVDCGGSTCPGCADGLACNDFSDCQSQYCSGSVCAACSGDGDCAPLADSYCDAGSCVAKKMDGAACGGPNECLGGNCVDGVCCDTACVGVCQACSAALNGGADGVCGPVMGNTDPDDDCTSGEVCDGMGSCATFCGLEPQPPGGSCPAACTGGCSAGTCTINCNASSACMGSVINCPAGWACSVSCGGSDGCHSATINCPDSYACAATCSAQAACRDLTMNCSANGTCSVTCSADNQVCRDADVNCGDNSCTATCSGGFLPTVACGTSCSCTTC